MHEQKCAIQSNPLRMRDRGAKYEDDAGNRRCGEGRIDVKMGMKNKRKKKKTRH